MCELLALNSRNRMMCRPGFVCGGVQNLTAVWDKVKSDGQQTTLNPRIARLSECKELQMNNIIYIVGLVVVVIAVLSFFGLR